MNGILGLLADAEKLTPDQRAQSVKNGVLPSDLANMLGAEDANLNQTQPMPQEGNPSIADQIMGQADQATDPKNEILNMIDILKSDINEIQSAIHSGEVKPYVGIPLLEKKIGELNKLESLIKPPQTMQNLRQPANANIPQEPQSLNGQEQQAQGLNALQSNLPQQMSYGGIVNLASGGDIDEDDEEEREYNQYQNMFANMPMGEGIGAAIMNASSKNPTKIESGSARAPNKTPQGKTTFDTAMNFVFPHEGGYGFHPADKGGHTKHGVTQSTLSAYLKKPASVEDVKNLTPEVARDLYKNMFWEPTRKQLAKYGMENDPKAQLVAFNAAMASGAGYSNPLIARHKGDPYGMLSEHTKFMLHDIPSRNPSQKVFVRGWGNRQKDLEELINSMAEGGIVGLNRGGHIAHYDDGGDVYDPMGGGIIYGTSTTTPEPVGARNLYKMINPSYKTPEEANMEWEAKYGKKKKPAPITKSDEADYLEKNNKLLEQIKSSKEQNASVLTPSNKEEEKPATVTAVEEGKGKSKSHWDDYVSYLNQAREDIKKSHETDKYMGLLMAGLGMMGGSSQFAGQNIGKGAGMGVQHYADLQKQQAAEKANLDKIQASAIRAQGMENLYREMRETPAERKAKLDRLIAKDIEDSDIRRDALNQSKERIDQTKRQNAITSLKGLYDLRDTKWEKANPILALTPTTPEAIKSKKAWDAKYEPQINALSMIAYPEIADQYTGAENNPNKMKFDAFGKKIG